MSMTMNTAHEYAIPAPIRYVLPHKGEPRRKLTVNISGLKSITEELLPMCGNEDLKELLRQIGSRLDFCEPRPAGSTRLCTRMGHDMDAIRRAVYRGEADKAKSLCAAMLRHMDG